jgi:exosortase/archaeosortase family protein
VIYHDISSWLAASVYKSAFIIDKWVLRISVEHGVLTNTINFTDGYVTVEEGCSGFKQLYQLLGLFLIFPGTWKIKLWYLPFSWLVMHAVNILRIVILSLAVIYVPRQWDFIHLWVLRPMFYVVIFGLWVIFIGITRKKKE